MTEEQLNIKYIQEKTGLVENDELIPIILEIIKDSYKAGLCQAEYDNTIGLMEENQELKKQLEVGEEQYNDLVELYEKELKRNIKLQNELERERKEYQETYKDVRSEIKDYKTQQKEFIEYLENEIKRLENTEFYIESMQKAAIATHKHNLSKYKVIIGSKE